ncbi:hypothetical protein [Bartonella sp. C271]|uniref:hypothetical protein n=1 Tax=Bartonella sp. C271 TaxID=3070220 RepID=UPI0038B4D9C2
MWFIIQVVITIYIIIPLLIGITVLVIYVISEILRVALAVIWAIILVTPVTLYIITLPMVETISYAFTKDKSKWKELIEKREQLRKRIAIKKKSQFAKHDETVFFRAAASTFMIICLILVVFVYLPDSFAPYWRALIILMPALPLTVCIAPIQHRIQVLPLSLLYR